MLLLTLVFILFCGGESLNLYDFGRYLSKDANISSECQKEEFLQGLENRDGWALKMLDAFGRTPKSITQGNNVDLGSFDQCVDILEHLDSGLIRGRYCYGGLAIPLVDDTSEISLSKQTMHKQVFKTIKPVPFEIDEIDESLRVILLAVCIPDSCLPSDFFGELGIDLFCQIKDENRSLDAGDITCLCFLGVIAVFVVFGTAYDLLRSKEAPPYRIFLAFSIYANGTKIMKANQRSGQILFFNGMKAMSIFWVILGHRYGFLPSFIMNPEYSSEWNRKWYTVYVYTAPLSVDTFLFVSGALLSYTFLKTMRKPGQKFNVFLFYLHRYLRLTPALAALYFIQLTLVRRITSGPLYTSMMDSTNDPCKENWWSVFLYVQNYVATDNMCLPHLWYLSIDMQLFILSPLVLLPMVRHQKLIAYIAIPALTLVSVAYTAAIVYYHEIQMFTDDYMNKFYYMTHTRFPPFLIGFTFGAFMLDYQRDNQKYRIKNQVLKLIFWGATLTLMAIVIFYNQEVMNNYTILKGSIFIPIQKPLWAVCLFWISYVCLDEGASFLNKLLSLPIFQVISKITYSTYLIHMSLLLMYLGAAQTRTYFTDFEGMRQTVADIFFALLIGAVWTLAFESPMIVIEQIIFGKGKTREPGNDNSNNSNDGKSLNWSFCKRYHLRKEEA